MNGGSKDLLRERDFCDSKAPGAIRRKKVWSRSKGVRQMLYRRRRPAFMSGRKVVRKNNGQGRLRRPGHKGVK